MTLSVDTILSPQQRAALAADPAVGGGNLLPSAIKANAHPDQPFLHSVRPITTTDGQPQHTFTLLELDQLVQSWSVFYLSKGVQPRDRVAVHIEDSYAYSVHFHALAQIGAIGVLINSRASEFIARSLLAQTTPVGLYVDRERLAQLGELPELAWVVVAEDVPAPPAAELAHADRFRHVAEDPVVILHSSGTTGVPKPTIHTHESIAAGPKFRLVDHKERPGAVTLTGLPQSHLGCIAYSTYAVLAGANTIAGRDYSGADLIDAVLEHRPTAVMSFAHAYSEIPALSLEPGTVDSVDFWVSIGDAVHEAHIHHLLRQRSSDRPEATFLDRLGTTELGWGALLKARTLSTERNDRCAGQPVGVSEVAILRKDGSFADANEVGLLAARGPAITPGYWGNSDLTYRFRLGGYWLTGDNAYRDEHGDHFLVDRTVDAIETPQGTGYSVFMEEAILSDVPDVVDIAVIAGRAGAAVVPVAVVTVRAEVEAEKLLRLANEALAAAGHLQLGVLEIAAGDEDLPVGVTGKVLKRQLREKYSDLATYVSTHTGAAVAVQGQL
ncbi:class I adenylate-forming enzyme family protein [Kutzneria chonburiensis]|uniref:Class I adenylate-forming enzyme family protein n=1 Tax=Kutzneria chonburiensis TaxID=1483604 RepID=A0ABV6N6K1_9PSEU|nr:class I adenylate-forming enzyme family protein [Kutzneria chonburiensis]